MKLKTEMKRCSDGYVCVSKGMEMQTDREHDAAYAHALVRAMSEPINPDYLFHGEQYRDAVLGRALDLMESWGYNE